MSWNCDVQGRLGSSINKGNDSVTSLESQFFWQLYSVVSIRLLLLLQLVHLMVSKKVCISLLERSCTVQATCCPARKRMKETGETITTSSLMLTPAVFQSKFIAFNIRKVIHTSEEIWGNRRNKKLMHNLSHETIMR